MFTLKKIAEVHALINRMTGYSDQSKLIALLNLYMEAHRNGRRAERKKFRAMSQLKEIWPNLFTIEKKK